MRIGIDLSVLQTPNRMRGIGATLINFLNHIPAEYFDKHSFVFFLNEYDDEAKTLELIDISKEYYDVRHLSPRQSVNFPLPGRLVLINKIVNKLLGLRQFSRGDTRFNGTKIEDLDVFIQFDTSLGLPKRKGLKNVRVLYDLIPYVMESEYIWGYRTARSKGASRYRAVRKQISRTLFRFKTRWSLRLADSLISISEQTKIDYEHYMNVRQKIYVAHLGADFHTEKDSTKPVRGIFQRYTGTVWGDLPLEKVRLSDKPFLLYIGGADGRRRLVDLVGAFNNLRARGHDIKLVLSGDTLFGAKSIPTKEISKYLSQSSYIDDIVFLGFTSEEEKTWLYQNALAYVFPTVYEGFGLPILEAMQHGCPVITYKNSSIPEIAEDAALYANGLEDILHLSEKLMDKPEFRKKYVKLGFNQSKKFTWLETTDKILGISLSK